MVLFILAQLLTDWCTSCYMLQKWPSTYRPNSSNTGESVNATPHTLPSPRCRHTHTHTQFHTIIRCNAHMSALRLNHYPALGPGTVQARPGQLRAGPHTDYGTITILLPDTNSDTADSTAGLQVTSLQLLRTPPAPPPPANELRLLGACCFILRAQVFVNGAWCNVVATPGALIVNVGDLMQRWTSDRWVSTCHRVAAAPAGTHAPQRLSVAYFHQPDWDAVVEALPVHPGDSNKAHPRYAPTTAGEHIKAKFEAAGAAVE